MKQKYESPIDYIQSVFFTYAEPYDYSVEEEKWVISMEDFENLMREARELEKIK